jgi:hypothetical protein
MSAAKSRAGGVVSSKSKKKILVGGFKGTKSGEARKALIAALENDGGYDVSQTTAVKPGDRDKQFASASGGASALLVGTVKKSGLVVSVHNGLDGALVQDVKIGGATAAKLNKNIADSAGLSLAEAIAKTKSSTDATSDDAPAPPADDERPEPPAPAAAAAADEEAKSSRPSGSTQYPDGHSPLELEAGLRAVHRAFAYHDTPAQLYPSRGYPAPLTYKLPLGPALFIGGTVYPLAFTTRGFAGNFGITAGYETNIATNSLYKTADPNNSAKTLEHDLGTTAHQYFVGLKARIPVSVHELGLVAAYGQQTFRLNGDEAAPIVPDLLYKFVRVSAEGRFRFDALTLGFHIGTRFVSSTGGLERDFFPGHVKTQDIEAGVALGYSLASSVDLIAGLDVTRYAFDFNPIPNGENPNGTTVIAGGATDMYTSGFLGLRYSLPSHE